MQVIILAYSLLIILSTWRSIGAPPRLLSRASPIGIDKMCLWLLLWSLTDEYCNDLQPIVAYLLRECTWIQDAHFINPKRGPSAGPKCINQGLPVFQLALKTRLYSLPTFLCRGACSLGATSSGSSCSELDSPLEWPVVELEFLESLAIRGVWGTLRGGDPNLTDGATTTGDKCGVLFMFSASGPPNMTLILSWRVDIPDPLILLWEFILQTTSPLKWLVIFLRSWTSTGNSSNSTGSLELQTRLKCCEWVCAQRWYKESVYLFLFVEKLEEFKRYAQKWGSRITQCTVLLQTHRLMRSGFQ